MSTFEKSPEIDGVRRSLEYENTEYGDWLSDQYWQLIDDVTNPDLNLLRARRAKSALRDLKLHEEYVSICLKDGVSIYGVADLQAQYDSVITQVLDIIHERQC